ncbi:hypothetical protein [Microvirga tunisiensis]|uniref:DUF5983 domain-containing protein n=1 Tax=Microvirga tunisiensis TaxID=2108360 RepID=A0A5N7MB10_9HYPH|nr:hypothetical protein [Microvirga tunisiensis]MPR06325.1 hypothetical protein [Microvirga tunisiensis]MPR24111.1 hypothetical protein [Microvirga tunisiensis]
MARTGHVVACTPFGWILSLPEQRGDPQWHAVLPADLADCVASAYKNPIDATHLEFDSREETFPGLKVHDDPDTQTPIADTARTIRALTEELVSFRAQESDLRLQASEITRRLVDYIGANQPIRPLAKHSLAQIDAFMSAPLGQSSVTPKEILNLAGQVSKNPVVLGMVETINHLLGQVHEQDNDSVQDVPKPKTRRRG